MRQIISSPIVATVSDPSKRRTKGRCGVYAMSIAEVVFGYATVAVVLIAAMVVVAIRDKANGQSIFARRNWNFLFALRPRKMLTGEMWLMLIIAAFITLCAGVIIVVFVLPYGTAWAILSMMTIVATLIGFMPRALK